MEPNPDPSDAKADLLTDPDAVTDPSNISPEDAKQEPDQTKDPGRLDDIDPIDSPLAPEPTVTVTVGPAPVSGDGNSSDGPGAMIPWILVVLLLAAVVALAVKAFGRRDRTAPVPVLPPVTASVPVVVPDPAASPVVPELITLADLITTPAAQTQVVRALRTVGVEPVDAAVGAPFDPEVHEAVATRPAGPSDQVGTIAVVHRAGWRSAHGVVRPSGVEVWTAETDEGA